MYLCKYIIILQSGIHKNTIILIRIHVSLLYQNCGLATCKMKSISTIITMSSNIITILLPSFSIKI